MSAASKRSPQVLVTCRHSGRHLRDCRPAVDDAETGAALNPRKLKRAARRACCFCTLRLRLKQAWSQVLGTKKPQAFAWGFLGLEVRSGRIFGFRCVDKPYVPLRLNPCICWESRGFWFKGNACAPFYITRCMHTGMHTNR